MLLRCYPKVTDFIYILFHQNPAADYRFLPVYSFGFFVALAFFVSAALAVMEMRRREKLGLLKGKEAEITVGDAPGIIETAFYFIFSFAIFFKLFGLIVWQPELSKGLIALKNYMLSVSMGSWPGGILGAAIVTAYFYYSKNRQKLPQPIKKNIAVFPSDSMGDIVVIAAILGVLGSNLFNLLENPDDYKTFWSDPVGSLFSGLSVYGGLICASIGLAMYAYIKKFNLAHFFDSIAAPFVIANGIGRIGCHVAGDGDWGIANLHTKPSWFPQFLWSSHYEHNIIDVDPANLIPNCFEEHCHYLTNAVYPTPLYELLMCTVVFFILWSLRKRFTFKPGILTLIAIMLIGIERYSIERWRDLEGRQTYGILGMQFRQSEIISMILFTVGIIGATYLYSYYRKADRQQ